MIAFLRGTVFQTGVGYADLDVNGVGYRVWMPERSVRQLESGRDVLVYTHHHVREDAMLLFGFATPGDRNWFEVLLGVSGIGPKVALQLMSATEAETFASAIANDDTNWLCSLPGIGKKTAQRLMIELRDKLDAFWHPGATASTSLRPQAVDRLHGVGQDIVEALVVLGYNEKRAVEIVQQLADEGPLRSVEDGLRLALQQMAK